MCARCEAGGHSGGIGFEGTNSSVTSSEKLPMTNKYPREISSLLVVQYNINTYKNFWCRLRRNWLFRAPFWCQFDTNS